MLSRFGEIPTTAASTDTRFPDAISQVPSTPRVVENAQQEPHWPWSFWGDSTSSDPIDSVSELLALADVITQNIALIIFSMRMTRITRKIIDLVWMHH